MLSGAVLGGLLGVARDDVIDHLFQGLAVGDLLEAFGFYDGVGVALVVPHRLEYFLGDLSRNRAVGDALYHAT